MTTQIDKTKLLKYLADQLEYLRKKSVEQGMYIDSAIRYEARARTVDIIIADISNGAFDVDPVPSDEQYYFISAMSSRYGDGRPLYGNYVTHMSPAEWIIDSTTDEEVYVVLYAERITQDEHDSFKYDGTFAMNHLRQDVE